MERGRGEGERERDRENGGGNAREENAGGLRAAKRF